MTLKICVPACAVIHVYVVVVNANLVVEVFKPGAEFDLRWQVGRPESAGEQAWPVEASKPVRGSEELDCGQRRTRGEVARVQRAGPTARASIFAVRMEGEELDGGASVAERRPCGQPGVLRGQIHAVDGRFASGWTQPELALLRT